MTDGGQESVSIPEQELVGEVRDTQATRVNTELGEVLSEILKARGREVVGETYALEEKLGDWDYECLRSLKDAGLILTTSITRTAPKDGRLMVEMYDVDSRMPQPAPQSSGEGFMKQTVASRPSKLSSIAGGRLPTENRQTTVKDLDGLIADLKAAPRL